MENLTLTKKTHLKGVFLLLTTALIWGISFVAQSVGMEKVEAFTFNGLRTILGAIVLVPFILIRDKLKQKTLTIEERQQKKIADKKALFFGVILGLVFFVASNLQQFAFNYSSAGKIAFITAIYMFIVPIFGLFLKKKVPFLTWCCIIIGFVGLFFLCIDPNNFDGINKGDFLAFLCSIVFAVHILLIEKFAPDVDGAKLSCVQFFVSGILGLIMMFIFESPNVTAIKSAIVPLLYSGILSCGVAYTFQIVGQKYTEATVASILLCMESVFAVIASAIILKDLLTPRELVGSIIMFAAIILSQFSEPLSQKLSNHQNHLKKR